MDQYARILATDGIETERHSQAQDFYDIEHGMAPPIYSDAFVTRDKRLARLVTTAGRGNAKTIISLSELRRWLEMQ